MVYQNLAKPGSQLGIRVPTKLAPFFVCPHKSLLDDVGRIELTLQAVIEVEPGQQMEIFTASLKGFPQHLRFFEH
jgi:hypothetical protein